MMYSPALTLALPHPPQGPGVGGERGGADAPGVLGNALPGGEELCAQGPGGPQRAARQPALCQDQ